MTTYTAPIPTAQLRVPVPSGRGLADVCARIRDIVTATAKVLPIPEPSVLLDRGGADNAMQIVITFAPDGDTAAVVKNDILRAIDEMETSDRQQRPGPPQDRPPQDRAPQQDDVNAAELHPTWPSG
jgi:hypothetical protein